MNDDVINQKIREREEEGLRMLMERYCKYVSAIVSNLSREMLSVEDVEELSADVFLAVWNSGARLREGSSLKPYLAQIARNAVISRLRSIKSPSVPFDDEIIVISKEGNPGETALKKEQQVIINSAVEGFEEPDREIFIRFYYFGEQIKAIGQRLGLKTATVKTKLYRCRRRVKKIFEERGYRYEETDEAQ